MTYLARNTGKAPTTPPADCLRWGLWGYSTVGVIKKRAIEEKMFETLATFNCSLPYVVFSVFFFFSGPEKGRFACRRISFYRQHTVATIEGHEVIPFLCLYFSVKLLIAKKARSRACPEEKAAKTYIANRLGPKGCQGCQKHTTENLLGPVFLCPGGNMT
jgi:hypothetical protein